MPSLNFTGMGVSSMLAERGSAIENSAINVDSPVHLPLRQFLFPPRVEIEATLLFPDPTLLTGVVNGVWIEGLALVLLDPLDRIEDQVDGHRQELLHAAVPDQGHVLVRRG